MRCGMVNRRKRARRVWVGEGKRASVGEWVSEDWAGLLPGCWILNIECCVCVWFGMRACTSVVNAIKNDSHFGSRGGMNVTYTRHSFQPAFYSYRRTTLSIQQIQLILPFQFCWHQHRHQHQWQKYNTAPRHGCLFIRSLVRSACLPLRIAHPRSNNSIYQINKSNCKFLQFMYI